MDAFDKKVQFSTFLDQSINNGDYGPLSRVFHSDFEGHFPDSPVPVTGVEGIRTWTEGLRTAFPDVNTLVEGNWMVTEDDGHHVGKDNVAERLAAYVVLRGTHKGDYAGAAASDRFVTWQQLHLVEFKEGKVVKITCISDRLTFYSETGAIDVPSGISGALPILELI